MGDISRQTSDLVEGYFDIFLGTILLIQVIYTYFNARRLSNLSFMNKLLLFIFLIGLISIFAGIYTAYRQSYNWSTARPVMYVSVFLDIIYKICAALITWIVGFKFIDSATKLETIEAHFDEK